MRSYDVQATTAGLLFIAATATSLIATAFLAQSGIRLADR